MKNLTHIVNKVKQAPWRVQRQWLGLLLVGLVVTAMVAGIYINVSARAAINGRQIQLLTSEIEENNREIADMKTELAKLKAADAMQDRAEALGFQPATAEDITYITVDGFEERIPADLSIPSVGEEVSFVRSDYKDTLFDWFTHQVASQGATP